MDSGESSQGSLQDEKLLVVLLDVVGFYIDVPAFILLVLYLSPPLISLAL